VGDALLAAVAQRLKRSARSGDTVARIGGDEFTVLVPSVGTLEELEVVAHKFVSLLHEPFGIDDHTIRVTASVGVAMTDGPDWDADRLMAQADTAMYRMKSAGRDGYRLSSGLENEPDAEAV
jgi:diguanylate cyclase (GGDEF)-like protein